MFLGFISLYFIKDIGFPDRFIPFGLMFGLIPLVGILVFFKKDRYKKIIALFLVFFIFYNIYSIDPAYLSGDVNSPGVNAGDKEYTIAQTIQFPSLYYGYSALVGAIYDVQGIAQRTNGKVVENLNISAVRQNSDTIIINLGTYLFNTNSLEAAKKKGLASYNLKMEILSLKNQFYINKICDLGDVYIVQAKG
jgi:hypothetical protein